MQTLLYFSYGSNMSSPRLLYRVPSARALTVASLTGHKLRFHKKSLTGSGKCDIENTGNPEDRVYGVVYEMLETDRQLLDKYESLGVGYEIKNVAVITDSSEQFNAFTYYALITDTTLKPFDWYREHVLRGAMEHSLPAEYIEAIKSIEAIPDPDAGARRNELSIYA